MTRIVVGGKSLAMRWFTASAVAAIALAGCGSSSTVPVASSHGAASLQTICGEAERQLMDAQRHYGDLEPSVAGRQLREGAAASEKILGEAIGSASSLPASEARALALQNLSASKDGFAQFARELRGRQSYSQLPNGAIRRFARLATACVTLKEVEAKERAAKATGG